MNSSTRISCSLPVRSARISGRDSNVETRSNAATSASGVSTRITPRLPDNDTGLTTAGYLARLDTSIGSASTVAAMIARRRQPGLRHPLARQPLVRARPRRVRRMPRKTQRLGDTRGEHDRPIADRDHAVDRPIRRCRQHRRHATRLPRETAPRPPRHATGRPASDTDRWRTSARRQELRRHRRTIAADIRSWSRK